MPIKSNCLLCMQYVWLKLCMLFGITGLFSIKCSHTEKFDIFQIKRSIFFTVTLFIQICFEITITVIDVIQFINLQKFNTISVFQVITNTLLIFNTTYFQAFYLYHTDERLVEFRGFIYLLRKCELYGLRDVFSVKYITSFRKLSIISLIILLNLMLLYTIVVLLHLKTTNFFIYVKTFAQIYSFCFDILHVGHVIVIMSIYQKVFNECTFEIMRQLTKRNVNVYRIEETKLEVKLKKLHRFFSAVYFNYNQMLQCLSSSTVVWFTTSICMVIMNVYIAIGILVYSTVDAYDISYSMLQVRIIVFLLVLNVGVYVTERTTLVVSIKCYAKVILQHKL